MRPDALQGLLITGVSGQVGGELARAFAPFSTEFGPVHRPLREELDLADPASIRATVRKLRPRWILNPAAYTAVDRAESEPEAAYAINADAVRVLGAEAHALGSVVLHFSTDYVFDGHCERPYLETDATNPQSVYGASKLAGEQALAASGAAHLIFRTSWVFGASGKNFLLTILRLARERPQLKVVADQHGAPTWSRDLARMTVAVVKACEANAQGRDLQEVVREVEGIYHAAGSGETTWFGFAQEALRLAGVTGPRQSLASLIPVTSAEFPTEAVRPGNSRMNCEKLERTFGLRMLQWHQAVAQVMKEIAVADGLS